MEFMKTLEEAFNPEKFIDQAEKNTHAVLAYVQPVELSKTLAILTSSASDYALAQVEAFKSITAIAKASAEDAVKSFTKSVK